MKYEVIGWTPYDSNKYPTFESKNAKDACAARLAVIENIRQNEYAFSGQGHIYGLFNMHPDMPVGTPGLEEGCAPVLNNGKAMHFSMRAWGAVMAEAWNTPNDDGYAFMDWYMSEFGERDALHAGKKAKYPPDLVDETKILPPDTEFETDLPEHYVPYGTFSKADLVFSIARSFYDQAEENAEKPNAAYVSIESETFWRLYENGGCGEIREEGHRLHDLKNGDALILFLRDHAEHWIVTEVKEVRIFASIDDFLASGILQADRRPLSDEEDLAVQIYGFIAEENQNTRGIFAVNSIVQSTR